MTNGSTARSSPVDKVKWRRSDGVGAVRWNTASVTRAASGAMFVCVLVPGSGSLAPPPR